MKAEFDFYQLDQIKVGEKAGLDVSVYAKPEFSGAQMCAIRFGLEAGVDVSIYARSEFDSGQMDIIRSGLQKGIDVSAYAGSGFSRDRIAQILIGLKAGLDVSVYARLCFNANQMFEIYRGLRANLDVSIYAKPEFDWSQMEQIREGLRQGKDVSAYADPGIPAPEMWEIREGKKIQPLSGICSQEPERPDAGMGIYSVYNAQGHSITVLAENEQVARAEAVGVAHVVDLKKVRCIRRNTEKYLAEFDAEAAESLRKLLAAGKPGVLSRCFSDHATEDFLKNGGSLRFVFGLRPEREAYQVPESTKNAWKYKSPPRRDPNVGRYWGRG